MKIKNTTINILLISVFISIANRHENNIPIPGLLTANKHYMDRDNKQWGHQPSRALCPCSMEHLVQAKCYENEDQDLPRHAWTFTGIQICTGLEHYHANKLSSCPMGTSLLDFLQGKLWQGIVSWNPAGRHSGGDQRFGWTDSQGFIGKYYSPCNSGQCRGSSMLQSHFFCVRNGAW